MSTTPHGQGPDSDDAVRSEAAFRLRFERFLLEHDAVYGTDNRRWAINHRAVARAAIERLQRRGQPLGADIEALLHPPTLAQRALTLAEAAVIEDERSNGGHAHSLRGAVRCLKHATGAK